MADFETRRIAVNTYSVNSLFLTHPTWVRNIGTEVVYIGKQDSSAMPTDPIDIGQSYPLHPGESLRIDADDQYGPHRPAFNTETGTSEIAVLGIFP